MDETNQNNTNQSQNQAPTWADFKPPVSTTPFGTGQPPGQPIDGQISPAVPPAPAPVLNPDPETPTFPPQSSVTAYPWMGSAANPPAAPREPQPVEPAVQPVIPPVEVPIAPSPAEAAVLPTPPIEVAAPTFVPTPPPAPAPVPSFGPPPQSSFTPPVTVSDPIPAIIPEVAPTVSVDPAPSSPIPVVAAPSAPSFYPAPMPPSSFNTPAPQVASAPPSEPVIPSAYSPMASVAPVTPPTAPGVVMPPAGLEPARTSPSAIPPISFVQATPQAGPAEPSNLGASSEYLSPQPVPAPEPSVTPPPAPPTPNKKNSALPIIAGAVVLAGLVVAAGYYVFTTRFASHGSATLGAQTIAENKDILANSQGPDSWVNDYSTSLLSVERGGLELMITDPPRTVVTPLAVATKSATSISSTASAQATSAQPVEVSSLIIRVAKAEVHLNTQSVVADGPSPDATKSASKSVDRWETLRLNDSTDVDLMNLRKQGGVLSSVGITYLAAGHYSETRLYITAATATLSDGTVIHLPITDQNGVIKIVKGFDLSTTNASKMIVDFNAPVSVTKDSSGYHFSPVLSRFLFNGQQI